ncbi:phosphoribosyltransferase-like protein [Mycolicibacterium grossiae]|uniref:phosphoribosyltransferase-like protein n=1 Tax=Mycolicibacterium grossiae TaxID=1552759 RepID=UPI000F7B7DF9|nr:hypothetical protein [Mycolicibacterium grossiae]QEM45756.1 hypothetical protein FZ046_14215 [Mycolicibacterium grossiae]
MIDVVSSERLSETRRGRAWLTNFAERDRSAAELLLDSLQVASPASIHHGLKSLIDTVTPLLQDSVGVLIPVLSTEDIRMTGDTEGNTQPANGMKVARLVAYDSFDPGAPIAATPGSEAWVGNLIRDLTGSRPGDEPGQWLHPATNIDTLHARRCRSIVLITDYTASGEQVKKFAATFPRNARLRSWRSFGWLRIVVAAYSASATARSAIDADSNIDKMVVHSPAASFADAKWTVEKRDQVVALCLKYTPNRRRSQALGYGASGGLFFTHTTVPNNLPYILRRTGSGWSPFFEGRTVPPDLNEELGHYQAPDRGMANIARAANQKRIAGAIDSGRLRAPADKLVAALALMWNSPQTPETLAHRLAVPDGKIAEILAFLTGAGFITAELTVTDRGYSELRHARRLDRITTARLSGNPAPYYPRALR